MDRRARGTAAKLLLVVASASVTIAVVELGLTLVGSATPNPPLYPGERNPPPHPAADPLVGWKLPPGTVSQHDSDEFSVQYRSNQQGFRSPRRFKSRTQRRRLAFLGDSFTMGSGVAYSETFASLLQSKLRRVLSVEGLRATEASEGRSA